ncbi:MAG: helix-turn-helix domain-containing protein, partial [Paenibacillaceae bacterium]|nr:helix-turn-helix domain-containing protein [Paenibacillaceae bacterium]
MTISTIKEDNGISGLDDTWFKLAWIERVQGKMARLPNGAAQSGHYWLAAAESDRGGLVIDGQFVSLRSGSVWIGLAGQRVEWIDRNPEGQGIYMLRFCAGVVPANPDDPETGEGRANQPLAIAGEYRVQPASAVMDKCRTIVRCRQSRSAQERLFGEAAFCELLGFVLGSASQGVEAGLERARRELAARYAEEVSVDRLAELAGVSRYHFMRLFKDKMGKSVGDYVTELRLTAAKRLMTERRELSLRQIAEQVGYCDAAYFGRQFKKWIGLSPGVYIQNRSRKVAAYSWVNIGQLLPLQIIPHAAPIDHFWNGYYRDKYRSDIAVPLSHDYEFNRQALRRARPDCIVALDFNMPAEEREPLEQIAPVLLVPWEGENWRGHLRLVAAYMNKTEEAACWLDRYDERLEQAKRGLPAAIREQKVLILKIADGRLFVVGRRAGALFYEDLRIEFPVSADAEEEVWLAAVSAERLVAYPAGSIVVSVGEE